MRYIHVQRISNLLIAKQWYIRTLLTLKDKETESLLCAWCPHVALMFRFL